MPDFVTLMLAVRDGQTQQVAAELAELGATVTATTPAIGYVKVNVPFTDIERAVAIDEVVAADSTSCCGASRSATTARRPRAARPLACRPRRRRLPRTTTRTCRRRRPAR